MNHPVRVRFAPSPTGGLHLGGMRTVLYNYLFARQHGGTFVLRVEDTDQTRFVPGAEEYIFQCLDWCGLTPDESPVAGGPFAPYRQSERKPEYRQYAEQLVASGHAYYAFDTPEELEAMRNNKTESNPNPQYDFRMRGQMRNSTTLSAEETKLLLDQGTPHVIRIKMPGEGFVTFTDMIRGEIRFDTALVDDKVLLKADGMPTYHLAVVADDYLMQITHAFRGEEWLPSAPVHLLLWEYLGWKDKMPEWAHLPLILKPDGHGKLSKRDGDRLGFPVFAMEWNDPKTGERTDGFKERGFLPEAFLNMLALLGWSSGTEQELFSLSELTEKFSMDRVHKGGAKFDFEKAKWFNHQYIQLASTDYLLPLVKPFITKHVEVSDERLQQVIPLIKERCSVLADFWEQGSFFFQSPDPATAQQLREGWNAEKTALFREWLESDGEWTEAALEARFGELAAAKGLKKGSVMLPLRIMLVGGKFGPGVFAIAETIGQAETVQRIGAALSHVAQ